MKFFDTIRSLATALCLAGLAACTQSPDPEQLVFDPYEAQNRQIHAFNKTVDTAVLRPVSTAYVAVTPEAVRIMLANGVDNLAQPSYALNHVLQGDLKGAAQTLGRFGVNTLLGFGGLGDPATDLGVNNLPTDFSETLQTWGVRDGAYIEVPLLGPSTERELAGSIVDLFIDPVNSILHRPQSDYLLGGRALVVLDKRQRFAPVINALLYESADSYDALRLSYLENRRFNEQGETSVDDLEDPYSDF